MYVEKVSSMDKFELLVKFELKEVVWYMKKSDSYSA